LCDACNKYKSHKLLSALSSNKTTNSLEIVNVDVWGPSPTTPEFENKYYVMFVDDYSRFSWLYACNTKSQVAIIFSGFKAKVENLLSTSTKIIQCDDET
jgi:hypothetical protein